MVSVSNVYEEVFIVLQERNRKISAVQKNRGLLWHGSACAPAEGSTFDGLNDSHITPGTMIFCSVISMNNFSYCVVAHCEQGSTSKNLCPCCKPQNVVIFKGVVYTERRSGSVVIKSPS